MVSNKHKNWVNNSKTLGIANINQNYQHKMLQIDITTKLKKQIMTNTKTILTII